MFVKGRLKILNETLTKTFEYGLERELYPVDLIVVCHQETWKTLADLDAAVHARTFPFISKAHTPLHIISTLLLSFSSL